MRIYSNLRKLVLSGVVVSLLFLIVLLRGDFIDKHGDRLRRSLARVPGFSAVIEERERAKIRARAMELSLEAPSFDYLAECIKNPPAKPDESQLRLFQEYYLKAVRKIPQLTEAHGLLGFLHQLLNEPEQAKTFYRNALELNPNYFWVHFNLGVLHWDQGNFNNAAVSFQNALNTPIEANVKFIYSSRVYQQIFWPLRELGGAAVGKNLEEGYKVCARMVSLNQKFFTKPAQLDRTLLKKLEIRPHVF